jgi:hypothetical protein
MRYLFFSIIVFFVSILCIYPQEKKFTIRTGAGYYSDLMAMYDGPIVWVEGGYRFNTGFYLNGRVSVASIDWTMSEGAFKDYKTIALRQMADITFSRPVKLRGNHFLEPGLGFKLKREYHLYPDFYVENISGTNYLYTNYSYIFYEIGFTICLDYYYQFANNFYMGLRTDTNVIWAVGFEGLTISPLFGFRF